MKRYLNTGQRSKYYAMETHEGIISKTDYEKVQNLLAKKSITGRLIELVYFQRKSTAQYAALYALERAAHARICMVLPNAFAIESSLPTQINP